MAKNTTKLYIGIGVGLVVLIGGVIVYSKFSNKSSSGSNGGGTGNGNTGGGTGNNTGGNNSNLLSFAPIVYQNACDEIVKKLNGCEVILNVEGDVVDLIKNVVKTSADWNNLVKVFGTRDVDNCGILTGSTSYTLPSLLKDQLVTIRTNTHLEDMQSYLKSIGVIL